MVEDTLFARVGHALRGSDSWIAPLARDLGIDHRTSGGGPPAAGSRRTTSRCGSWRHSSTGATRKPRSSPARWRGCSTARPNRAARGGDGGSGARGDREWGEKLCRLG